MGTAARPLHSLRRPPQLPHEFRMQFPDVCGPWLYEMPGISTLAGCRVKCLWRNCMRMCVDQDVPWPACIRNLSRETGVAFARAGRASDETAIAFAGEKWAFFVPFSGAEVSSVSTLAIQGCAVVMVVSRWSASAVAEVSLVSTSPSHHVLCAKFVTLHGLEWAASAKQLTLHRSWIQRGTRGWPQWGFCTTRSWLAACRRRVVVLMTPFPPSRDGGAATRSGVVPKMQTTSVKNAENGPSWARWSAFWAQRYLSWSVVCT